MINNQFTSDFLKNYVALNLEQYETKEGIFNKEDLKKIKQDINSNEFFNMILYYYLDINSENEQDNNYKEKVWPIFNIFANYGFYTQIPVEYVTLLKTGYAENTVL